VSEPAAVPEPEHGYGWRERRERDLDVLALVTCGVLADYGAAVSIVATLDREQLVSALWCVLRW
jgi:hypothetical protein